MAVARSSVLDCPKPPAPTSLAAAILYTVTICRGAVYSNQADRAHKLTQWPSLDGCILQHPCPLCQCREMRVCEHPLAALSAQESAEVRPPGCAGVALMAVLPRPCFKTSSRHRKVVHTRGYASSSELPLLIGPRQSCILGVELTLPHPLFLEIM